MEIDSEAYDATEVPSIVDTLMNIIPTNPFNSLSTQNLLQIIFFCPAPRLFSD